MSVAFRQPGEPRQQRVGVLSIPPERRIRFLGGPADHVQVYLHFVGSYSVPCLGDECELCQTPPLLFGYAAVQEYVKPMQGKWLLRPAILPVTEGVIHILESDFRDRIFLVNRRRGQKNGAMEVTIETTQNGPALPCFDVKERLLALWKTRSRDANCKPLVTFYSHDEDMGKDLRFGT